jgi:hypothetical protein
VPGNGHALRETDFESLRRRSHNVGDQTPPRIIGAAWVPSMFVISSSLLLRLIASFLQNGARMWR